MKAGEKLKLKTFKSEPTVTILKIEECKVRPHEGKVWYTLDGNQAYSPIYSIHQDSEGLYALESFSKMSI